MSRAVSSKPTRPRDASSPALQAWQRRGDPERRDALWVAACYEAAAIDDDLCGRPRSAERARVEAKAIVRAAVVCQDAECTHQGAECLWRSRLGGRSRKAASAA